MRPPGAFYSGDHAHALTCERARRRPPRRAGPLSPCPSCARRRRAQRIKQKPNNKNQTTKTKRQTKPRHRTLFVFLFPPPPPFFPVVGSGDLSRFLAEPRQNSSSPLFPSSNPSPRGTFCPSAASAVLVVARARARRASPAAPAPLASPPRPPPVPPPRKTAAYRLHHTPHSLFAVREPHHSISHARIIRINGSEPHSFVFWSVFCKRFSFAFRRRRRALSHDRVFSRRRQRSRIERRFHRHAAPPCTPLSVITITEHCIARILSCFGVRNPDCFSEMQS